MLTLCSIRTLATSARAQWAIWSMWELLGSWWFSMVLSQPVTFTLHTASQLKCSTDRSTATPDLVEVQTTSDQSIG